MFCLSWFDWLFAGRAQEAEEHAESRPPCQHDSELLEVEKMILKPERHADADRVVAENRVLPDDGFQILLLPARCSLRGLPENRALRIAGVRLRQAQKISRTTLHM